MFIFFFFFILGFSSPDCTIDLSIYTYYLILTDEGVIINQSKSGQSDYNTIFSKNTIINGTVYLNIDVILDQKEYLQLVINPITQTPNNLDLILKKSGNIENSMNICFADTWDVQNIVNITFHTNIDLSYILPSNVNIKTFSIDNNQIIAQILPEEQRKSITICYYSDQCSQYSVEENENYIAAKNFHFLNKISSIFEKSTKLRLLLTKIEAVDELPYIDWTKFSFFEAKPKLEFIGLIQGTPSKFDLFTFSGNFPLFIVENVQFTNKENDESLRFSVDEVFVKDTNNVFPDVGTFSIDATREYRKSDSGESPFQKITGIDTSVFDIFPDFELNGDLILTVNKETIDISKSDGSIISTIPNLDSKERLIYITDQKNPNRNKISIKPGTDVDQLFDMRIVNCDQILIEISGWNDTKYAEKKITFYSNDLSISTTDSFLRYTHYDLQMNILDDNTDDHTSYSFCLGLEECHIPHLQESEYLRVRIQGDNVSDIISNLYDFLDKHQSIVDFGLVFDARFSEQSFDLESHLPADSFNNIIFYGGDDRTSLTKVNLASLPSVEYLTVNIWNCIINFEFNCTVQDLVLTDNGGYTGDGFTHESITSIQNIDISNDDVNLSILEDEIECLGVRINSKSMMIFFITVGDSPHQITFDTKVPNPFKLSLIFLCADDSYGAFFPISISDSWSQLSNETEGSIAISIYDGSNVVYKSINSKVRVFVSNIQMSLLSQIPAGCSQDKIVNCYNSDVCNQLGDLSISEDEIYITTRTEKEFSYLIDLIKADADKKYQYLRLILSETSKIKFQKIPSDQVDQVQLYRMKDDWYQSVSLSSDIDTSNIKSLLLNQVGFKFENTTKLFQFKELVAVDAPYLFPSEESSKFNVKIDVLRIHCIKSHQYSGLEMYYDCIEKVVYELFTDLQNKDYIISVCKNTFYLNADMNNYNSCDCSFPGVVPSKSYFLIHGSSESNHELIFSRYDDSFTQANCVIDTTTTEITINFTCHPDAVENFFLNVYTFNENEVQVGSGNCSNIESNIIHYPFNSPEESGSQSQAELSSASDELIGDLSVSGESKDEDIGNSSSSEDNKDESDLDFTSSKTSEELGESSSNKGDKDESEVVISSSKCDEDSPPSEVTNINSSSETITNAATPTAEAPIGDDIPELPVENTDSTSSSFVLTNEGFVSQETGEGKSEKPLSKSSTTINTITFTQKAITITESGSFTAANPLYFVAAHPSSTITIGKEVTHSNIGITSANNPTVHLQKSDNPVSFMNNISGKPQYIHITSPQTDQKDIQISQFSLREVNNHRGDFSIILPPTVTLVSFTSLLMSRRSSFSVTAARSQSSKANLKLFDEAAGPSVRVKETVAVSQSSEASFANVEIEGTLSVYDNSIAKFNSNSNFSENSKIELIIQKVKIYSEAETPLIYFERSLNSVPSKIILSSNNPINVVDLPLLSSEKFENCEALTHKIVFKSGKHGKIDAKCSDIEGLRVLSITADENHENKKKKIKISAGGIAGIVIACIVIIAAVIGVTIYIMKRKRDDHMPLVNEETDDMEI